MASTVLGPGDIKVNKKSTLTSRNFSIGKEISQR